jgi:2-keto-4-pentenoate hydratase/2-oxohepta-3-ene-1,7-dioic acid hydratase in catechol pathway
MKLVTIETWPSGRTGALVGDDEVLDFALAATVVPIAGYIPTAMPALLAGGTEGLDLVRRVVGRVDDARPGEREQLRRSGALKPLAQVKLMAPVPRPGILLSHGRAYKSHLKEMNREKPAENPSAFMKNVNSIIGAGTPIRLPPQCPDMVDQEAEFSIVFGAPCHNIKEEEAMACVAGYTMINDVSARNWVENFQKTGDPDLNRMGKQLPGFTPMGPVIATKDEIPDPHNVTVRSLINDRIMQDANTSDLIWTIPFLIAFFARWYAFKPGDVLSTGSPAGVGYGRNPKVFVKAGDQITVSASGVGALTNPIVA